MPKNKEKVVVSVGGSVFLSDDPRFSIGKLTRLLTSLSAKFKLFVVVGGGSISRYYIDLGRKFGAN
ncbi:MAG: UMP kinase, partial [Thermoplasmata archaeon]|nr:UMP kinase [Thermoplasmata archaeon]